MAKDVTTKMSDIDLSLSDQDMMMVMMVVVMAVMMQSLVKPIAATAATTQSLVQSLTYEGRTDAREVDVPSDSIVWLDFIHAAPRTPWTWVLFENDGPNDVEIGINEPNDRFILNPLATKTVDKIGAREKISIIFFYCRPTETARVRVVGEY